ISRPDSLELLPKISHVVLDKTGTLTRPDMHLAEVRAEAEVDADHARILAGRLERVSRHPLATAFARFDDGAAVADAETVTAAGVAGQCDGIDYRLGKPAFLADWLGTLPVEPDQGQWIALASRERLLAWFRVDSPLRAGARELVDGLKASGLSVWLASGDRADNVRAVARTLGIEQYRSDCSPADKLALVRGLQANGARVAMVGDGINDAPVLAGADVSMALAEGADIARTQADLVVTGKDLSRVSAAFDLAPRVRRIVRQNLAWAFAYNITALPFAAAGFVPPWLAAIGMSASSLLVVMNGQRLARPGQGPKTTGHAPGQPMATAPAETA
ncbi:MAG: HAD-IC family P-type ATPase, partial [Wenzhouxiangella sp.]|nr:HAD-IC family P-type ATPase [Wenzhouxiangella sp.]